MTINYPTLSDDRHSLLCVSEVLNHVIRGDGDGQNISGAAELADKALREVIDRMGPAEDGERREARGAPDADQAKVNIGLMMRMAALERGALVGSIDPSADVDGQSTSAGDEPLDYDTRLGLVQNNLTVLANRLDSARNVVALVANRDDGNTALDLAVETLEDAEQSIEDLHKDISKVREVLHYGPQEDA